MPETKETTKQVLECIKILSIETPRVVAKWDEILDRMMRIHSVKASDTEIAIVHLMEAGLVYEPTLGLIKVI